MKWKAHAFIGVVLTAAVLYFLVTHDAVLLAVLSAFGGLSALLPDLDHESGKGRKVLDMAYVIFALLISYIGECGGSACLPGPDAIVNIAVLFFILVGAYFVIFILLKPRHRGITHTILAGVAFAILAYMAAGTGAAIAGFVGYFSHLLADRQLKIV